MIAKHGHLGQRPRRLGRSTRRRAMTVLVVLALVSIALAMSYSILRSQMTGIQLQANSDRGARARQAALAGLSSALRAMRLSTWSGVGTPLAASINSTDSYSVTFTVGDTSLVPGTDAYREYPYRVNVLSAGTSINPSQTSVSSTYKVQAVVKLIPRQKSAVPSNWSTMLAYTVYQLTNSGVVMSVPCHVEGPVRLQSSIKVDAAYSWSDSIRSRYYSDLNLMRSGANEVQTITRNGGTGGTFTISFSGATTANIGYNASSTSVQNSLASLSTIGSGNVAVSGGGSSWTVTFAGQLAAVNVPQMSVNYGNLNGFGANMSVSTASQGIPGTPDYRQFSGPISTPTSLTSSKNLGLLTSQLALSVSNISQTSTSAPTLGTVANYRIYSGGPLYNVAQLPSSLANTTLAADPLTNPLGIFYASSNSTLGNNVTITGTVITGADLIITGTNVKILPFDLPPLEGSTTPIRLPSVVALRDFRVASGAQATVNGVVYLVGDFDVDEGSESTSLALTGNMIVGAAFIIDKRTQWKAYGGSQWDIYYTSFQAQLGLPTGNPFFPQWLATVQGRNYVPLITLAQDTAAFVSQWQNLTNPIYITKTGDSGLHWDLVSWTERP